MFKREITRKIAIDKAYEDGKIELTEFLVSVFSILRNRYPGTVVIGKVIIMK